MAHFDLSNYATVAERITRFYEDHPDGRVSTELVHISESGKQFVVKAKIYASIADDVPVATGLAEEHFADRGPNETSPLENAETSAIGRALVNWKYSSTAESRPSREEMEKVNRGTVTQGVPERVKQAAAPSGDKIQVLKDERWAWINQAADTLPDNHKSHSFVTDIRSKGDKYGSLSEKQIAAAFKASCEYLGTPKPSDLVAPVAAAFPGATELLAGEEPF